MSVPCAEGDPVESAVGARTQTTGEYALVFSAFVHRAGPAELQNAVVRGPIFVFTSPDTDDIEQVRFWLDDPAMSGPARQVENNAPYDFAGGTVATANPWDTRGAADGTHTITAQVRATDGSTTVVNADFEVENVMDPPDPGDLGPDQVHLGLVDDTATTLSVIWRTSMGVDSTVQYREVGQDAWTDVTGSTRASGTTGTLHEVLLQGLLADTTYEYRVLGPGDWSQVFTTTTAPVAGDADIEAVFFADTGIDGRPDGLTTGVEALVDTLAQMRPDVLLAGGDYAYWDTDQFRFPRLDSAIDAWFDQMQPAFASTPVMPTFGNHEVLLDEDVELWRQRFVTRPGHAASGSYSFDIGDVHFISLLAVAETTGLSDDLLAWLESDIATAHAVGARWILPYFHAVPFGDGRNHPANLDIRADLGPVLETGGVKVAMYAHDQSFERSLPLTDVPATNTPTSARLDYYDETDGVTYVKSGPGGKLSNKNSSFSEFASDQAPAWTAARDNTRHHVSKLTFCADGSLRVDTYGLTEPDIPPVLVDSFRYTVGDCGSRLAFDPPELEAVLDPESSQSMSVSLTGPAGATVTLEETVDWLGLDTTEVTVPGDALVTLDAAAAGPGEHVASMVAETADGLRTVLPVRLAVPPGGEAVEGH